MIQSEVPRFHRNDDRVVLVLDSGVELCPRRAEHRLVPAEVAQIAAESRKDARPVHVVNRTQAIKTNVGDSIEVLIHVERRPGRRFISEVLELARYDADSDLFDYSVVYMKEPQE